MAKEPQIVHSFPKNPLEEVRSSVTYYKGKQYVDIRIYYKGDDGEFHPSKKGVTLSVELFPELEAGFQNFKEALEEDNSLALAGGGTASQRKAKGKG